MKPAVAILSLAVALPVILLGSWYVAARNAPVTVVVPPRPPIPKRNGFPVIVKAASELVRVDEMSNARLEKPRSRVFTLAEKRELVSANRGAVQKARVALSLPYYEVNTFVSLTPPDGNKHSRSFRNLARAMTLAGDVAWEEGRQSEAVDLYLDAVTLGRRMPNQTGLVGQLSGLTCESIGRIHLWRRLKTMDTDTARRCLARLNALEPDRVPLTVSLTEEKYSLLSWAKEAMEHPERIPVSTEDDDPDENSTGSTLIHYTDIVPKKYVADALASHMEELIAQAGKPYSDGNRKIEPPRELLARFLAPESMVGDRCRYTAVQTGDALLRTALAIRVYKDRTGKLPANLTELVRARLLPRIPQDPFAPPGTALRYQPTATTEPGIYKAVIHSVGPDGVDNGARGIEIAGIGTRTYRSANADSRGDMVAGWFHY